jgi:hypothetical protein
MLYGNNMIINEILNEDPQVGDSIDLELGDTLIETVIDEITEDGIVVRVDETALTIMIDKRRQIDEAKYRGRTVSLNKPFMNTTGKSKRSVYVKNPKGNVVKVNFGQKGVKIKKNNPARRKSFRARHNCSNPGPKHKARYWSCKFW